MNLLTRIRLLIMKSISGDGLIFEMKKENDRLKLDNKELRLMVESLKKGLNFKFYDEDLEKKIIEQLSTARKEVNIAVAWVTSDSLINKIKELKDKGVEVNLIVDNNKYNIKKQHKLIESANRFEIIYMPTSKNMMHNKYCIIDNKIVIDGSYNWSNNARKNEEHIIVVESKIIAEMYKENFDRIINNVNYGRNTISLIS